MAGKGRLQRFLQLDDLFLQHHSTMAHKDPDMLTRLWLVVGQGDRGWWFDRQLWLHVIVSLGKIMNAKLLPVAPRSVWVFA